ncbi:MAG: lamin tail domain-containing protein, partial [Planctomycetaceae bacterium]|nr:lamin tail domain-containing protein [Planctomycetaceae bacterium]
MSLCSSLFSSLNGTVGRVLSTATALVAFFSSQAEAQVVISQVYGAGGNSGATYNRDFVELYNTTSAPVSLSGWSVQYASSTGNTWSVTNLAGSIPANGYYLVGMSSGANGATLPAVDVNGAQAMAATAGKVALSSSTATLTGVCPTGGSLVDFVGYGSGTNCFEGAGPTASLGATTAALRGNFGCTDTNSNSADFTTATPSPRNSGNTNSSASLWYLDADNDGYGLTSSSVQSCTQPSGYVANGGDCDDGNSSINPGALDVCNTGIDEDCDGTIDNPPVAPVFNVTQGLYFCTIQGAINAANPGDVLDIGAGTYTENVIVNKTLSLVGNSGFPATRPVIVGTGAQVILVAATNVTLENLQVDFDGTGATSGSPKSGIVAPTPSTYDGLLVKDCLVQSTATTGVSIFNSFGLQLASLSASGTANVTLTGNTFTHSGTSPLGRGVRTWYTHGSWTGNTASGVYSFQVGDVTGGILNFDNNTLDGVTEINSTAFAGTHSFSGNLCGPSNANGPGSEFALLELKNLQFAGVTLDITGNTFAGFTNFGLFSGRGQNLNVANNVFTPAVGATGFRSARFDTKQRTNAAAPYAALALTGISVTGNTFNGNAALGQAGIALELANSDSVSSFAASGVSVTGNTFAADNATFVSLNASTGSTSGDPVWAGLSGSSATTRAPVSVDVAALGNSFDAGLGVTLASAMTNAELFAVENKVQHELDNTALGLVHVKASE